MGPELESKGRPEVAPEASAGKENGIVSADSKDKYLKCDSNYAGYNSEIGGPIVEPLVACRSNDVEVNITGFTNSGGNGLVKAECQESTENSSSFDDTDSDIEHSANLSDSEVMSAFHGDGSSALPNDGFADIFRLRKKKLTPHWRTFIRPLMWRCKWVELQIKKFDAQAQKYHRKLAEYNKGKHFLPENSEMQGIGMKSFPFPSDSPRDRVLKRKKRRRIEEMTSAASYMSHHNLFSYYEKRICKADGTYVDDPNQGKLNGNDESEANDEGLWLESRDGDNSVEQMFRKIGILQSQISNLKSRLNKVKSENAGKLSLVDGLGLHVSSNGLISSARSLASPPNNGDRMPVGSSNFASQLILQYNMDNVVMPGAAVSSHGEVSHLPDVIESTNQSNLGGTCPKTEDDILIYNERMNEEMNNFDDVTIKHVEKPQVAEARPERTFPTVLVEQDLPTDDQPPPKIRSISKLTAPKSRKKRGKRKASW